MDDIDRAQKWEELFRQNALDRQRRTYLGDADRVIAPGECMDCGGMIGAARLKALPEARTCIDCAESAERRRRTHAGVMP